MVSRLVLRVIRALILTYDVTYSRFCVIIMPAQKIRTSVTEPLKITYLFYTYAACQQHLPNRAFMQDVDFHADTSRLSVRRCLLKQHGFVVIGQKTVFTYHRLANKALNCIQQYTT